MGSVDQKVQELKLLRYFDVTIKRNIQQEERAQATSRYWFMVLLLNG